MSYIFTLDSAPVCLDRWNAKSRLCICRKTFLAIFLIECCATFANTAFLNSLQPAAPARAIPSIMNNKDHIGSYLYFKYLS